MLISEKVHIIGLMGHHCLVGQQIVGFGDVYKEDKTIKKYNIYKGLMLMCINFVIMSRLNIHIFSSAGQ